MHMSQVGELGENLRVHAMPDAEGDRPLHRESDSPNDSPHTPDSLNWASSLAQCQLKTPPNFQTVRTCHEMLSPAELLKVISEMIMALAEAWCLMGCAKLREMTHSTCVTQGFTTQL